MSHSVKTISGSFPSICIPRVFDNITQDFIQNTFNSLFGGKYVECVDVVEKINDRGEKYKRVFIHFRGWPTKKAEIAELREKLLSGQEVKIMYDARWFWKCSASKSIRPSSTVGQTKSPYIVMDDTPDKDKLTIKQQRDILGEQLYYQITTLLLCGANLAGKITGMLLELDVTEINKILTSRSALITRFAEARELLMEAAVKESDSISQEQKAELFGDPLYHIIATTFNCSFDLASKVTGMLLEMSCSDIYELMKTREILITCFNQAIKALEESKST